MRILQVILPGASQYELKSQRIDRAALLAKGHAVSVDPASQADLAHVYGPQLLARSEIPRLTVPYVSNGALSRSRWPRLFDRTTPPAAIVSPLASSDALTLSEAVEDLWFPTVTPRSTGSSERRTIGSYAGGRPWVRSMAEQTMMRIHRFRDDVNWLLFDEPPAPADPAGVDLWVDPARDDGDLDGFVAEAFLSGTPVVAARTAINELRSDKGRTANLVRPGDSNELTHAILSALFKPEVAQQKVQAARLTASKFRSERRLRLLMQIYETLTR